MTTPACYSPCQWGPFGHRDLWEQHAGRRATVLDGTARPKAGAWARQDPTGLQGPNQDLGTVLSPAALLPLQSSYQEHKQSRQRAHLTLFSKCPSTSAYGDGEIPVTFVYFPENTGKHSEVLFSKVQVGMRNTAQTRGTFHHPQAASVTSAELSLHYCCCSHLFVQSTGLPNLCR